MTIAPKLYVIDLESSPIKGYSWSTYQTNINHVIEPSKVISCAWKEVGSNKVYCKALPDYEGYAPGVVDDEQLVKTIWTVLDKAEIIIGQNSNAFDLKKLNSRFVYYKLPAPSPYQTIDTLLVAKKSFRFDSNSLDSLSQYLNEGEKAETGGFNLWLKCMAGDKDAWKKMKSYNIHDVELTEKVYLRLRPFISNHPSLGAIAGLENMTCSVCMSPNLQRRGYSMTQAGRKQRYQCSDCSAWSLGGYERRKFVVDDT